jgi:hypothetical protein
MITRVSLGLACLLVFWRRLVRDVGLPAVGTVPELLAASQPTRLAAAVVTPAPIRATVVKRAYESDPVTMRAAGLGLTVLLDPSSQLPGVFSPRGRGSSWSARSRAAARTNELDAGKRREILESEEGPVAVGLSGVVCWFPVRGGRSGLTSTHPAPPWCGRLP